MDEQPSQNPTPEKFDQKIYTVEDLMNHPEQLTIKSLFGIVILSILLAVFIWFFIVSYKTMNFDDRIGTVVVLLIFSYGLFLSLKRKLKK